MLCKPTILFLLSYSYSFFFFFFQYIYLRLIGKAAKEIEKIEREREREMFNYSKKLARESTVVISTWRQEFEEFLFEDIETT
jgi:hypothetical protein